MNVGMEVIAPGVLKILSIARSISDWRQPECRRVCVLTPTGTHLEVARAASAAGKHVLIEKPLDVNLQRADEMIRLCRANRTKLGVIFQMRFGTVATRLKEAVQSGALGRIFLADAVDKSSRTAAYYNSAEWRGTKALESGGLLDLSPMPVELADRTGIIAKP